MFPDRDPRDPQPAAELFTGKGLAAVAQDVQQALFDRGQGDIHSLVADSGFALPSINPNPFR